MNATDLVATLTEPRPGDSGMYPTAYAIDFVMDRRRAFERHTGVKIGPSYNVPSLRQACWDAIGTYARVSDQSQDTVERQFADAHLAAARIKLA